MALNVGGLHALDRHGDADAMPGLVDFAVNVRGGPPEFVRTAIADSLADLARYPTRAVEETAVDAIAATHGCSADTVLLLAGAADGFEMLPRLGVGHAALIQPSFTEPEVVLRAAGVPITQVLLDEPWTLDPGLVPDSADLVLLGNPTNPTSVLHPRAAIDALRRPGRIVVVDEAFADLTLDPTTGRREPESVADLAGDDVAVIRSVTKTFGLAGLRAGYLLGSPGLLERLRSGRRPWAVSTPALAALAACLSERGDAYCDEQATAVAAERHHLLAGLRAADIEVVATPAAPYVLLRMRQALRIKEALHERGIAIRSCANFVGLSDDYLRLAVREAPVVDELLAAMTQVRKEIGA